MYIFTVWNKLSEMKPLYENCIKVLSDVYPSFEVIYYEDEYLGRDVRYTSDKKRLEILLDYNDECLYIDADCLPVEVFQGGLDKLGFGHYERLLDNYLIYKPYGSRYNNIIHNWIDKCNKNKTYNWQRELNGFKDAFIIDETYFKHLRLTGFKGVKK